MKMSRETLKSLIKECLVEILTEGLGSTMPRSPVRASPYGTQESVQRRSPGRQYDPRLDTPTAAGRKPTGALRAAIKESAGGNPLMASIFADTAATTLREQIDAGDGGAVPSGAAKITQQEQFNGTPEDVFGEEATGKWAHLAFMPAGPNKAA